MLDKDDKKEIKSIVTESIGEALEEIVLPRIQKIEDDFEDHKKENKKQFEAISEKIDTGFTDVNNSLNRIETLVRSEVKYVDVLSGRVTKLEKKPA